MDKANQTSLFENIHYESGDGSMICFEIFALAGLLGFLCESWWVFGVILTGLLIVFAIPVVNRMLVLFFSFSWCFAGYLIGDSYGVMIACIAAALFLFTAWKVHMNWFCS